MTKPILFFDMDDVLVDFQSGINKLSEAEKQEYGESYDPDGTKHKAHYDDVPGIFAKMEPVKGAIEAVHKLAEKYDVYILSTAPWKNPTACNDKLQWVKDHFGAEEGSVFYKRVIFSHHKDLCLCHGDYLIDDRDDKNGTEKFKDAGKLIHFGAPEFPNWDAVAEYLMRK